MKSCLNPVYIVAIFVAACGHSVYGDVIFNAVESGGNVVISGGGTVDLGGLTFMFPSGTGGAVIPNEAFFGFVGGGTDAYVGFSGPTNFGVGGIGYASSSSGSVFSINGLSGFMNLPSGYISGTQLSSSATFNGATFASLGMTPGTYVWTWGSGANVDSLTLNIGSIPEPGSLLACGALGLIGFAVRRRKRNQHLHNA